MRICCFYTLVCITDINLLCVMGMPVNRVRF